MKNFSTKDIKWPRLVMVFLFIWYFYSVAQDPFGHSIIGAFNLIMHEAGHWIFIIGGEFMSVLGGSLLQLLVPLVFALYFLSQRQVLGVTFCMLWLGQSMLEVAFYAGDAIVMQLPLLGGEAVIHDWNWLLNKLGLISHTKVIAGWLAFAGWSIIILGAGFGIKSSLPSKKLEHITTQ